MLTDWLGPVTREAFFRDHFQREPLAQPATARGALRLLNWGTVARLVDARADMLLVRNSKLKRDELPSRFEDVLALFRDGYSVVLRQCERHEAPLRELADNAEAAVGGQAIVQVYATPGGFHSFSWHYDVEDVFIAQTVGVKEYFLRRNTINPEPTLDAMPKDMQYERETTPIVGTTLMPGDFLYIPRGWWHVAKAKEDALSISVGVLSDAARSRKA